MSNYSERISRILAENSLTLADFCYKIGLNSTTTIAKIVSENRKPSSKTIGRIIKAFPLISYDWLTTGNGEMIKGVIDLKKIKEDELTVTAKQIINHLDINNKNNSPHLCSDKQVVSKIESILYEFDNLENRVQEITNKTTSRVTDKIELLYNKYNKGFLLALDKILRMEQDLENIKMYMATNYELDKMDQETRKKLKRLKPK